MAKLNVVAAEDMLHGESAYQALVRIERKEYRESLSDICIWIMVVIAIFSPAIPRYFEGFNNKAYVWFYVMSVIATVFATFECYFTWIHVKNIPLEAKQSDSRILLRQEKTSEQGLRAVWVKSGDKMYFGDYLTTTGDALVAELHGKIFRLIVKYSLGDECAVRTFLLSFNMWSRNKEPLDFVLVAEHLAAYVDMESSMNFRQMVVEKFPQIAGVDVVRLVSEPPETFDLGEIYLIPKANQIAD